MVQGLGCRVGVLEVSSLNLQFWLGFLLLCGALHYPEEESHLLIEVPSFVLNVFFHLS